MKKKEKGISLFWFLICTTVLISLLGGVSMGKDMAPGKHDIKRIEEWPNKDSISKYSILCEMEIKSLFLSIMKTVLQEKWVSNIEKNISRLQGWPFSKECIFSSFECNGYKINILGNVENNNLKSIYCVVYNIQEKNITQEQLIEITKQFFIVPSTYEIRKIRDNLGGRGVFPMITWNCGKYLISVNEHIDRNALQCEVR